MLTYVNLRETSDEDGNRQLGASLKDDGTIVVHGHDLGPGVESFFGPGITEYEWALSIRPSGVRVLKMALACDADVLTALRDRFSGDAAANLQDFLDDNAVPYEFWSRVEE
ncbi:MAG: hypothetical protein EA370_16810 [Wenzhouxiangella sp.]|nr:MAG: hypothetical protein EA370_16810 [Wenzhouxiangella sp.]